MLFNGVRLLGRRGEPLGACSDLLPPHGDVAVGSEGEISHTQGGEELQKRQVMGGGRGAVCRECFASPPGMWVPQFSLAGGSAPPWLAGRG